MTGNGQSPKDFMYTDSRKAQRDRSAHSRANLVFSRQPVRQTPWSATTPTDLDPEVARARVRAGIKGFVPASQAASA
jgi:hypothetical protein